ncbi:glutamyl-tRNA reductase [Clostridium vincentii]|uniref:Glutamyl-tRNA reductase n=1 Tax=Clostridium vincentii TaxID=52704 RepID=A0A2T0BE83_9CLOT|nr:glutamyl-tRNA reductase [Clostridium vincentii]PRR82211.1 Glutamyl-tRNA reductase [Clostridium vincentii]
MSKIVVASINFDTSDLIIREKVHFTGRKKLACYDFINENEILSETIILSTCNRSEIYGVIEDESKLQDFLKIFETIFHLVPEEIEKNIELKQGDEAVRHIFEVAGGFKSMVIGEDQILGQVKDAYFEALEAHSSSKYLNKLFLCAIAFGKKFRSCSGISNIPTSVGSIGVKLLKSKLQTLKGKKALVIGLGEMNKIIMKYLLNESMDKIYIANRTLRECESLGIEVELIAFEDRYTVMDQVDTIISCTSAPHSIIKDKEFNKNFNGKEMCILDLAMPRDVESTIAKNSGIEIIVIDDLKEISNESLKERVSLMENCSELMESQLKKYYKSQDSSYIKGRDNSLVG